MDPEGIGSEANVGVMAQLDKGHQVPLTIWYQLSKL